MEIQKIVLFGASDRIGQNILNEALARGYKVTAITEDLKGIPTIHPNLKVIQSNSINTNKSEIISKIKGKDIVISAYELRSSPSDNFFVISAIIEGVKIEDVRHFIAIGYPGSQELEPNLNIPSSNKEWKIVAQAQQDTLRALKKEKNLRWGYAHYPEIETAIEINGRPDLGNELTMLTNEGDRRFEAKNYAQNILDEIEQQMREHTEL